MGPKVWLDDEKMLGEGGSKEFGGSEQKYMENHGNNVDNKHQQTLFVQTSDRVGNCDKR